VYVLLIRPLYIRDHLLFSLETKYSYYHDLSIEVVKANILQLVSESEALTAIVL